MYWNRIVYAWIWVKILIFWLIHGNRWVCFRCSFLCIFRIHDKRQRIDCSHHKIDLARHILQVCWILLIYLKMCWKNDYILSNFQWNVNQTKSLLKHIHMCIKIDFNAHFAIRTITLFINKCWDCWKFVCKRIELNTRYSC